MSLEDTLAEFTQRDWQSVESTDDPVRFAFVGLGWWTVDKAIPAAETAELCEPTVVVSSSEQKANRLKKDNNLEAALTYDEFSDGEATDAYDAVYIATPNDTHLDFVRAAAANGKAALCEKPMEMNTERCQEMIEVCDEQDVTLMIAYRMQTEPVVRRARELVERDFLGELNHIHSHISLRLADEHDDPDHWKFDPERGGGSTFGTGVYPINTTRFIIGDDPLAVNAQEWSTMEPFTDVDENSVFQVEFPGQVFASFSTSHNNHDVSNLRFVGTEGEINLEPIFHPWQPRTMRIALSDLRTEFTVSEVSQMVEEFDYFSDCLLTGSDPHPDGEHGQVDVATVQAVHKSAKSGNWVSL